MKDLEKEITAPHWNWANRSLAESEALETELQNAHGELKSTLRQLQELRDVLQKAQLSLEEKYTTIKDLTAELRWVKF